MTEWHESAIGELGRVVTGKTPPAARPEAFGEDHPFVTPTDMVDQRYMVMTDRYLSADGAELLRRLRVPAGALMVSCIGWQLGKVAFSTADSFTNQQINTIIPDTSRVDPLFLYYHLRTRREELKRLASGGTRTPILNKSRFERLTVPLPPRPSQELIATFLGSIDDLIENNQRRVAVLEEMTRAIYREWFVRFRYPGHEDVPLVGSALGPIPAGWELSTCGGELTFIGGGTPSKSEPPYWDGGDIAWYTPTDLTKTGWRYAAPSELAITGQGLAKSSARLFSAGSVMMTSRATLGVLAIATTEATTNQGFIVILPDERWNPGFIYEWLDSKGAELSALGTGATFKEITKGSFKSFPFVVPTQSVLDDYRVATEPLENQVHVLEQQTRSLSALRDLLLPKLVTGQIDVSALDLDALLAEGVGS